MQFNNLEVFAALVVYLAIVCRWFMVINRYHVEVLANDSSYEYKDHPIFKGALLLRAVVFASVAPVFALVNPSYFNTFFDGVNVKTK